MSTESKIELEDELDDDGTEEQDGDEKEPTPEELKASVANLEKALKKANREAARLRNEKKATEAGKETESKGEEKPADDRYKRSAVAAATRAEFKEAGFTGTKEQAAKLARLLDLDDIDVDEDGEVDGLEDAVADLKEQFPALFGVVEQAPKTKQPKPDTAPKNAGAGSIATSTDKVAEDRYNRMFGGGRSRR